LLVDVNCMLCRKKKLELRLQGRTEDEVSDRTLFGCCDKYDDVEAVCEGGLRCGMKFLNSSLGQFRADGSRQRISSSIVTLLAGSGRRLRLRLRPEYLLYRVCHSVYRIGLATVHIARHSGSFRCACTPDKARITSKFDQFAGLRCCC